MPCQSEGGRDTTGWGGGGGERAGRGAVSAWLMAGDACVAEALATSPPSSTIACSFCIPSGKSNWERSSSRLSRASFTDLQRRYMRLSRPSLMPPNERMSFAWQDRTWHDRSGEVGDISYQPLV